MSTFTYRIEEISTYEEPAVAFAVVEIEHHDSGSVFEGDMGSFDTRQEAEDHIGKLKAANYRVYSD